MSKNWRERMYHFFYEDLEEDESEEAEQNSDRRSSFEARKTHRDHRKIRAKMTYDYPSNHNDSFQFPLIPDRKKQREQKPVSKKDRKTIRDRNRIRVREPKEETRSLKQKRKYRRPSSQRSSVHRYHSIYDQRKVKELEDIPAYMRRKKSTRHEFARKDNFLKDENIKSETESEQCNEKLSYSRPDELDRVFRQRDGYYESFDEKKQPTAPPLNRTTGAENVKMNDEITTPSVEYLKEQLQDLHHLLEEMSEKTDSEELDIDEAKKNKNIRNQEQKKEKNELYNITNEPKSTYLDSNKKDKNNTVPIHLLNDAPPAKKQEDSWLKEQKRLLQQTLKHFKINAQVASIKEGPTITRIEIELALGVKVSRIRNLVDDIKLNLAAQEVRIEAPIPGKNRVGIEIPNKYPETVHIQEMIASDQYKQATSPLTVALGLTVEGKPYVTNIAKMPHGLIAGATGSGKSVCVNTMILSLLYKASYHEVKLLLIDPKMVELTQYNGIPHLLSPVITDAKAATIALKWVVNEMERRYELFAESNVRNIEKYNDYIKNDFLPYIVIIIDELADLMFVSPREVEDYICRIAQKARAAGIHLIVATQRPSVDVITGLIKANIPSRIAFSVSSQVDSRTIMDTNGAENLLGKGDMLFIENGVNQPHRIQGAFVSDDEIDRVVAYLRTVAEPTYAFEQEQLILESEHDEVDELFEEAIHFILDRGEASTSMLQRRFKIGYNRAARLIDSMYDRGIVSSQKGSQPRDVLITKEQWYNK